MFSRLSKFPFLSLSYPDIQPPERFKTYWNQFSPRKLSYSFVNKWCRFGRQILFGKLFEEQQMGTKLSMNLAADTASHSTQENPVHYMSWMVGV